jgi:NADH dehydrogenase FAD-containing subunit
MASPAAQWVSAEHDRGGRVVVRPDLSLQGFNNIFVIGDTASVKDASGRPVPGLASAAKQMGKYVGKLIAARVAGQSLPPFRYRHEEVWRQSVGAPPLWNSVLFSSRALLVGCFGAQYTSIF